MGFGHVEHNVNMKFNRNLLLAKANTHTRREFMDSEFSGKNTFFGTFLWFKSFVLFRRERETRWKFNQMCVWHDRKQATQQPVFSTFILNNFCSGSAARKERSKGRKISLGFHNTLKIPTQHAIPWIPIHIEAILTFEKIENSCYSLLEERKQLREWFAKIFFYFIVASSIVRFLCSVQRHFFQTSSLSIRIA